MSINIDRYYVINFLLVTAAIIVIFALVGSLIMALRAGAIANQEAADFRNKCEIQCAPFAHRTTEYDCECRNNENHWVPQKL